MGETKALVNEDQTELSINIILGGYSFHCFLIWRLYSSIQAKVEALCEFQVKDEVPQKTRRQ